MIELLNEFVNLADQFLTDIIVVALISLAVSWIIAMIINLFETEGTFASHDFHVSFFWCFSLLLVMTLLALIGWVLYFWGFDLMSLFPNIPAGYSFVFGFNSFIFFMISVLFYFIKVRGYFQKIRV